MWGRAFDAATLIEPLACCVRGVNRAGIQAGDSVLVLGAGSNGLMLARVHVIFSREDFSPEGEVW